MFSRIGAASLFAVFAFVAVPAEVSSDSARDAGGKVFVSLALDPHEAGSLRDAVAGLGASIGFFADARFKPLPGPDGTVLYSGWLPAGRLGDVLAKPGVRSLRVENGPRRFVLSETSGEFLVWLRLGSGSGRKGADIAAQALASSVGFRPNRVVDVRMEPGGRAVAVLVGTMPLASLPRAMGLAAVEKIAPAETASQPPAASARGFFDFVARRGPWLIVLTLILLWSNLRALVRRIFFVKSEE